jgi:hypothetical protein
LRRKLTELLSDEADAIRGGLGEEAVRFGRTLPHVRDGA